MGLSDPEKRIHGCFPSKKHGTGGSKDDHHHWMMHIISNHDFASSHQIFVARFEQYPSSSAVWHPLLSWTPAERHRSSSMCVFPTIVPARVFASPPRFAFLQARWRGASEPEPDPTCTHARIAHSLPARGPLCSILCLSICMQQYEIAKKGDCLSCAF